jgi:hypothetical protein
MTDRSSSHWLIQGHNVTGEVAYRSTVNLTGNSRGIPSVFFSLPFSGGILFYWKRADKTAWHYTSVRENLLT